MENDKNKYIREHFNDFRYLNSTDEPNLYREFVRYDKVVEAIHSIEDSVRKKCIENTQIWLKENLQRLNPYNGKKYDYHLTSEQFIKELVESMLLF